jgi:hypothetical protein
LERLERQRESAVIRRAILCAAVCAAATGCTHRQLTRSTVLATGTVMDIQYRTVLNNLALLSSHPEALPSHIDLADGVVQVSDEAGLTDGGFSTGDGFLALERFGPTGSRSVSEQWGTEAVTDPQRLTGLQDLYRAALGLPPLPPPNVVTHLRRPKIQERKADEKESPGAGPAGAAPPSGGDRAVSIDLLLSDVPPPGWFHLGCKKDVPKDACYVGRYGDRYAWVTADGVPGLARFTVTVLGAIRLEPGRAHGPCVHPVSTVCLAPTPSFAIPPHLARTAPVSQHFGQSDSYQYT